MVNEMIPRALKALADPTRFHIVEFLGSCCCGQVSVGKDGAVEGPTAGEICCHITGAEKITSTVSHHLHELEAAGLLTLTRKGKSTLCSLDPTVLKELATYFAALAEGAAAGNCCQGENHVKE
jgi:ArsR family transcriptional regulator, arsenate/arsenite/antimonite-responsive transcriptional repressor